jgi:predicted transcriptional regulator
MLFRLSGKFPTTFIQSDSREQAIEKFKEDMSQSVIRRFVEHESFKCEEVSTLDDFLSQCPKEFTVQEDVGF